MEAFDKAGASFVSITQSFNTTTSMGRLTLNMLLSFVQFEREVTAERIRDKIAASKARGMWMGGVPPIGYAPHECTLRIVEDQAAFVRGLFARYLELGTVRDLAAELDRQGARSPVRTYPGGRSTGGGRFSCGQLYYLLGNPIYIGRIRHRDTSYPGQHEAIIDAATWEAVQAMLAGNTRGGPRRRTPTSPSLLAGLVRDESGEPLIASHACKGKTRYRYYVSRSVRTGGNPDEPDTRVPARELERAVIGKIAKALADPLDLAIRIGAPLGNLRMTSLEQRAGDLAGRVQGRDSATIASLVAAVHVLPDELRIDLGAAVLAEALGLQAPPDAPPLTLSSGVRLSRSGMAMKLVFANGRAAGEAETRPSLIKLLIRARDWWDQLAGGATDRVTLARQAGVIPSYVSRVVRLAFLSPKVVEAILSGKHPADLDRGKLLAPGFPASWKEQERVFLGA